MANFNLDGFFKYIFLYITSIILNLYIHNKECAEIVRFGTSGTVNYITVETQRFVWEKTVVFTFKYERLLKDSNCTSHSLGVSLGEVGVCIK